MTLEKQVAKIVRSVLESSFENIQILSIEITPGLDEDGDKVLNVQVIFDAHEKSLDARRASGLARHILPQIEEIGETGFPIFSFIAKSEIGKLNSEAG